jgi:acetyl esterase/lipase
MKNYLLICVVAATMGASSVRAMETESQPADVSPTAGAPSTVGAVTQPGSASSQPGGANPADAAPADANADAAKSCEHVLFSRKLKYGESERNVLDVAAPDALDGSPRAVLLFVAGDNFAGDGAQADTTAALQEQAMCFAARNGMVAVSMSYRLAPAAPWPAGARDVASATSWIHQNIDLFGGDPQEVVVIGYAVGAFHVASFMAHKEFQETDSDVAGVVLVSGIYRPGTDAADGERSYLGADVSKYNDRSAVPGIIEVEVPIVLAWSTADPPRLVAQGEKLKEVLCNAGHCPRTALLAKRDSPASVFDLDDSGDSLARRTKQLLRQIEARGLP